MSGRMKRFRNKMGRAAIDGKISVAEARWRISQEAGRRSAGPAVTKAAKPAVSYPVDVQYAARLLNAARAEPRDPNLRENIRPGSGAA